MRNILLIKIVILFLCTALVAQKRLPFRTGPVSGIGGGDIPVWVSDPYYEPTAEAAPTGLAIGQGVLNAFGRCMIYIGNSNRTDYVYPTALNRTNRWLLALNTGGGRDLQWIGEPAGPPTCSVSVGTPFTPVGKPIDNNNRTWHWSQAEDYVAYSVGGTGINGSEKLYEMRCTASCELPTATWVFNTLRDFGGNDAFGVPWFDVNNKTFCKHGGGSPPGCTKVDDYSTVVLNLTGVSPDADYFRFSLRGGTKSEYAACLYRHSTAFLGCRYLDTEGSIPTSATPAFPGTLPNGWPGTNSKGNGSGDAWNFPAINASFYQMNGGTYTGTVDTPWLYRLPEPTARVQTWENAQSITGTQKVGHGSSTTSGIASNVDVTSDGSCAGGAEVNWVQAYRVWPDITEVISNPNLGVPTRRDVLYVPATMWGGGWHITGSPRVDRQNWVASSFYEAGIGACLGSNTTYRSEIVMHKITTALAAIDGNAATPLPYPPLVRLGRTFASGPLCQPHANISMDGSRIIFKSNLTGGVGGSGAHNCAVGEWKNFILYPLNDIDWGP